MGDFALDSVVVSEGTSAYNIFIIEKVGNAMKRFIFLVLCIILSGLVIVYGKVQYDNKLSATNQQAQAEMMKYQERLQAEQLQKELEEQQRLERLVANLTPELQSRFLEALDSGETLKVVAMGSGALTSSGGAVPWPDRLQERVNKAYQQKLFEVKTLSFGEGNTFEVVGNDQHLKVAELKPDIFILEPFIWNDNGYARIQDTLYHLGVIVEEVKRDNEDVVVFVQPPNPIYGAEFFVQQVNSVKEYSLEEGLYYFDHWEVWPGVNDELLRNYIEEGDHIPNEAGHEIWAEYIVNYFAAE